MRNDVKARVIAYYLPQYHPVPENDKYWGKEFNEWGEGSYMEPDKRDGHAYLDMLWNTIKKDNDGESDAH